MNRIRLVIPPTIDNGEQGEMIFENIKKIMKSSLFKNAIEISSMKDKESGNIHVSIIFTEANEKKLFQTMINVMEYEMLLKNAESVSTAN